MHFAWLKYYSDKEQGGEKMSATEEKIPIKLDWTGEELEAVIKMLQIFPLALGRQNLEARDREGLEKHNGWTSEKVLKSLWVTYAFDPPLLIKARTALGRCGLIKSTAQGKMIQGGFGKTFLFINVPKVVKILASYDIDVPEAPPIPVLVDRGKNNIVDPHLEEEKEEETSISELYDAQWEELKKLESEEKAAHRKGGYVSVESLVSESEVMQLLKKVEKLIQYDLLNKHKVVIALWKLGNGEEVAKSATSKHIGLECDELALEKRTFDNALRAARNEGLVSLNGGRRSRLTTITPLVDLNDLIKFYRDRGQIPKKPGKKPGNRNKQNGRVINREALPSPALTKDPRILSLMSEDLRTWDKVLVVLWKYGNGGAVERWVLREAHNREPELGFTSVSGFSDALAKAKERELLEIIGKEYSNQTIKPIATLDDLVKRYERKQLEREMRKKRRIFIRPEINDPRIPILLKRGRLTNREKLLVVLWMFGPEGADRWTINQLMKEDAEAINFDYKNFSTIVRKAEKATRSSPQLIEVAPSSSGKIKDDLFRPLVSVDYLADKYSMG
ncbi:hypothetical protein C4544_03045 [candidate division WS5 bacterium]|uniref:Uncharacterized protein n=1 Tax=candidate division WS5 bacterium TaxID=2093353 RepID=A0A419DEB0_9BACT|nr:MAG: hypothetical protein C4544_03045 [candidate division WS5 bacterium]